MAGTIVRWFIMIGATILPMTKGIRLVFALVAVLILDAALAPAAEPVPDEGSRLQALRLIFPGATHFCCCGETR
jgi:hypothetical protein